MPVLPPVAYQCDHAEPIRLPEGSTGNASTGNRNRLSDPLLEKITI